MLHSEMQCHTEMCGSSMETQISPPARVPAGLGIEGHHLPDCAIGIVVHPRC